MGLMPVVSLSQGLQSWVVYYPTPKKKLFHIISQVLQLFMVGRQV